MIIIGVILLVMLVVGMTRIKFRFAYSDGIVAVAQVLFIKLRIYPKKKKKHRLRNYRIKRFRKRVGRNIKRADAKAEKAKLKAEKKRAKSEKKSTSDSATPKKRAIKPLARMLLRILRVFIRKFPRYLQTTVSRLVIGVATDDAANTAVTYGYVVQLTQYTITFIEQNSNLRLARNAVVSVYPDFTTSRSTVDIDITLSIRIWQVLSLGIALALAYLKKDPNTANKT